MPSKMVSCHLLFTERLIAHRPQPPSGLRLLRRYLINSILSSFWNVCPVTCIAMTNPGVKNRGPKLH